MIRADTGSKEVDKELETLRQRVTELEALKAEYKPANLKTSYNESRYRLVAENITDVVWTADIDSPTRLTYISPSVTLLLGYTVKEAMDKTMEEVFSPDSYVKAMEALLQEIARIDKKHLNQRQSRTLELELIRKDGFVVPVEVNFSFIYGVDGQPCEIMAVGRDITERKWAEVQLRQSEAKYSTLVEKGNDGVVIIQDGVLKFANSRMIDITGSPMKEVIGRSFLDFVSPEYRALVLDKYKKRINGEKTGNRYEIELLPRDARRMPVEISGSAIEHEGRPADLVVIRDITQRREAEKQQKENEEELKTYLENAPDGIYISDLKGIFLYGNKKAEEILGYKREQLVGKTFLKLDLLPPKHLARAGKLLALNVMGKNTGPDEFELVKNDKSRIWVEINTAPIKQGHKSVVIGFVRDITERKQTEEKLHRSEERQRTIINNAPIGVATSGTDRRFISANEAFCQILGYSENELQRLTFKDITYSDDVKDSVSLMEALDLGKISSFSQEKRYNKKNGQVINGKVVISLVRDQDGSPVMYIAELEDITERKLAEEALKTSEQNFRNSLDTSIMGTLIVDKEWHVSYVNQALLDIFGYKNINEVQASPPAENYTQESSAGFRLRMKQEWTGETTPTKVEVDIIRKDGVIRHLQVFRRDVFWDGRQQHQLIYNDITELKQVDEALKVSEQNFRNSLNNSPMGIRISDIDNYTLHANQAFLEMFGYNSIEEVRQSPPQEHFTPESYAAHLQRKERFLQDGSLLDTVEIDIKRKDGNIRHLQVFNRNVLWDGKEKYQTIYNDITERKQIENALKASEQNFRNSLNIFSIGIRITDVDAYTFYSNQAFLDMFGYANIDEVRASPPQKYYTHESYADYLRRKENFTNGESLPDIVEIDIIRKDGAIRRLQLVNEKVLWDGKELYQGLYFDITERKQAEKQLEQAAQEWRTTFDSITDLISIRDKDNRIVRVNKAMADMLKTTPKELIGRFCYEVMHGAKEPPVNCPHWQTLINGKPISIETFNSDLGVYLQESASPIFNEKRETTGSVVVARDVTKQKRMEEQLIMTDRLASIGELSSGIAHELNNPLTSVIGFSQLLMEGEVPEDIKKDLGIVYSEAQRAAAIVKNLLTFARKHAPVKQLSQVNTVIEDVLRLRAYEEKVNNIEVESRLAPNLPETMIDHFQMQQVFLNIVVNAEFAMQEAHQRGKIIIITERSDEVIRITFTDDGPGISPENLKHIFDPFFTTKEVGKGTGLGLSICHGIVTEHGGRIYARSKEGIGASFIIELPIDE